MVYKTATKGLENTNSIFNACLCKSHDLKITTILEFFIILVGDLECPSNVTQRSYFLNTELTEQEGWKTQNGRLSNEKNTARDCALPNIFSFSAVLSLPAV